jgi:hypothetical protein
MPCNRCRDGQFRCIIPIPRQTRLIKASSFLFLLARLDAPLGEKLRGKALAMYVVAEGTDKYRAVYSLAEIDPAFHTGTVIVADREDGQPIAKDGPFKLVNTEDNRPARWVRNLASIQLGSIPSPRPATSPPAPART